MNKVEVECMALIFVFCGGVLGASLWEQYRPAPEVRHSYTCTRSST